MTKQRTTRKKKRTLLAAPKNNCVRDLAPSHLIRQHEYGLQVEPTAAVVEKVFKRGAQQIQHHDVVVALHSIPSYGWDTHWRTMGGEIERGGKTNESGESIPLPTKTHVLRTHALLKNFLPTISRCSHPPLGTIATFEDPHWERPQGKKERTGKQRHPNLASLFLLHTPP